MLKVLVAEDNVMLADILEDSLISGGYDVCGVAHTVDQAVALADLHQPDIAVLDFRLGDGNHGSDIRPRLKNKNGMAILYVSADHLNDTLTSSDGTAYIQKPYSIHDLLLAVRIVHDIKTGGSSLPAFFPKNFHLLGKSIHAPQQVA